MPKQETRQLEKYRIEGLFWDPMYRDFDIGDYEIKAYSQAQAEKKAKMHWMYKLAKRPPAITKLHNNQLQSI